MPWSILAGCCNSDISPVADNFPASNGLAMVRTMTNGTQSRSYKPGTKLIREWKGKIREVVIAGGTYIWAGQHYRSLSQIARAITGTRWSGPRFFGLEAGQRAADG